MAIMENIRRSTDSVWMKLVFGIIVLVFVFWGIGAQGPTNTEVAKVNGIRITDTELHREMRKINTSGAQDEDDLRALQQEVIQNLIREEVLLQEAERIGLEVSSIEIALYLKRMTSSDGSGLFAGPDGTFDQDLYKTFLERNGYKQSAFEEEIRRSILREKLRYLAMSSVTISDEQVWEAYEPLARKIGYSLIVVSEAQLTPLIDISDDALASWLLSNQATVDLALVEQQNTYKFEIAQEILQEENQLPEVPEDGSENFVEAVSNPEASTLRNVPPEEVTAYLESHEAEVTAAFEEKQSEFKDRIARDLLATEQLSFKAEEIANGLHSSWAQNDEALEATLSELNGKLAVPLQKLTMAQDYIGRPPMDMSNMDGLMAYMAVESSPGLMVELSEVEEVGVLAESKPTRGGRLVLKVESLELPDRAAFDASSTLNLGTNPTTQEPITLTKNALRFQIWTPLAQDFYSRWVTGLVTQAEVEQTFIP